MGVLGVFGGLRCLCFQDTLKSLPDANHNKKPNLNQTKPNRSRIHKDLMKHREQCNVYIAHTKSECRVSLRAMRQIKDRVLERFWPAES